MFLRIIFKNQSTLSRKKVRETFVEIIKTQPVVFNFRSARFLFNPNIWWFKPDFAFRTGNVKFVQSVACLTAAVFPGPGTVSQNRIGLLPLVVQTTKKFHQKSVLTRVGARGLGQVMTMKNICFSRPLARRSPFDFLLFSRYIDRQKTKIISQPKIQFPTKFDCIQSSLFRKAFARTVVSTEAGWF